MYIIPFSVGATTCISWRPETAPSPALSINGALSWVTVAIIGQLTPILTEGWPGPLGLMMFYTSIGYLGIILTSTMLVETKGKQSDDIEFEYLEMAENKFVKIMNEKEEKLQDEINEMGQNLHCFKEQVREQVDELKEEIKEQVREEVDELKEEMRQKVRDLEDILALKTDGMLNETDEMRTETDDIKEKSQGLIHEVETEGEEIEVSCGY